MDYLVGFVIGYFCKEVYNALRNFSENAKFENKYRTIIDLQDEWDNYKE